MCSKRLEQLVKETAGSSRLRHLHHLHHLPQRHTHCCSLYRFPFFRNHTHTHVPSHLHPTCESCTLAKPRYTTAIKPSTQANSTSTVHSVDDFLPKNIVWRTSHRSVRGSVTGSAVAPEPRLGRSLRDTSVLAAQAIMFQAPLVSFAQLPSLVCGLRVHSYRSPQHPVAVVPAGSAPFTPCKTCGRQGDQTQRPYE